MSDTPRRDQHPVEKLSPLQRQRVVSILGICSCHPMDAKRDRFSPQCAFHEFGEDVGDLIAQIESLRLELAEYRSESWGQR